MNNEGAVFPDMSTAYPSSAGFSLSQDYPYSLDDHRAWLDSHLEKSVTDTSISDPFDFPEMFQQDSDPQLDAGNLYVMSEMGHGPADFTLTDAAGTYGVFPPPAGSVDHLDHFEQHLASATQTLASLPPEEYEDDLEFDELPLKGFNDLGRGNTDNTDLYYGKSFGPTNPPGYVVDPDTGILVQRRPERPRIVTHRNHYSPYPSPYVYSATSPRLGPSSHAVRTAPAKVFELDLPGQESSSIMSSFVSPRGLTNRGLRSPGFRISSTLAGAERDVSSAWSFTRRSYTVAQSTSNLPLAFSNGTRTAPPITSGPESPIFIYPNSPMASRPSPWPDSEFNPAYSPPPSAASPSALSAVSIPSTRLDTPISARQLESPLSITRRAARRMSNPRSSPLVPRARKISQAPPSIPGTPLKVELPSLGPVTSSNLRDVLQNRIDALEDDNCCNSKADEARLNEVLGKHQQEIEAFGVQPRQCPLEGQMNKNQQRGRVARANKKHSSPDQKGKFVCFSCGGDYTSRQNLFKHLKSHLKIKTARCEYCEMTFAGDLARHYKTCTARGRKSSL